jgi:hypothetical protein
LLLASALFDSTAITTPRARQSTVQAGSYAQIAATFAADADAGSNR